MHKIQTTTSEMLCKIKETPYKVYHLCRSLKKIIIGKFYVVRSCHNLKS